MAPGSSVPLLVRYVVAGLELDLERAPLHALDAGPGPRRKRPGQAHVRTLSPTAPSTSTSVQRRASSAANDASAGSGSTPSHALQRRTSVSTRSGPVQASSSATPPVERCAHDVCALDAERIEELEHVVGVVEAFGREGRVAEPA